MTRSALKECGELASRSPNRTDDTLAGIALYGPPSPFDDDTFYTEYPATVQEYADIIRGNLNYVSNM